MNAFSISGLLTAINSIALGILVLVRNPNRKISVTWFLFTLAAGIWGIGITAIGLTKNFEAARLIWQLSYAFGVIWIAPLFYHFVCIFLNIKRRRSIFVQYGIGLLFVLNLNSPDFFKRIDWVFNSFYYVRAGWLYYLFFLWWLGSVAYSHIDMIRVYSPAPNTKKNQIKYFFLATVVGYSGGVLSYLPKFGFDIYPWGAFFVSVYPVIMGYAILKYNLMDVRIFIRRTGLLVGVYALLLVAVAPVLISFHRHLISGTIMSATKTWSEVAAMTGALSLGPFLYAYLIRQSNFFQERRAAGLTHELKSPLAAIQGALEIIREHPTLTQEDPKLDEYLTLIERNSTRLETFVNDLLQVFNPRTDSRQLVMEIIDFKVLCAQIVEFYVPLAKFKNNLITFVCDLAEVRTRCDQQKIETVISNLLSNAVKFTSDGNIQLVLKKNDGSVQVSVMDTGCGITANDLPHIFEPFYRGKNTKNNRGSGIGLTIAKAWVESHGGNIFATSDGEGRGAIISFVLDLT